MKAWSAQEEEAIPPTHTRIVEPSRFAESCARFLIQEKKFKIQDSWIFENVFYLFKEIQFNLSYSYSWFKKNVFKIQDSWFR